MKLQAKIVYTTQQPQAQIKETYACTYFTPVRISEQSRNTLKIGTGTSTRKCFCLLFYGFQTTLFDFVQTTLFVLCLLVGTMFQNKFLIFQELEIVSQPLFFAILKSNIGHPKVDQHLIRKKFA